MKNIVTQLLALGTIILFFSACSDLKENITVPEDNIVSVHGSGALNPTSPQFHGSLLKADGFESCRNCHAKNLDGGLTGVSCINCHPAIEIHREGIVSPGSDNFHGTFIQADNWDLANCASCHGADYAGGISNESCNGCHTHSGGPEACNTCHGDFTDPNFTAPPTDLARNTETSSKGVGTHTKHLFEAEIGKNVACGECHLVPADLTSAGHIDDSPGADLIFGTFASKGISEPVYDAQSLTCQNTYCHGNFEFLKENSESSDIYTEDKIVGNNAAPIWNIADGSQASCGTCHDIPPKGHLGVASNTCNLCHGAAFNPDGTLNPNTHMDGEITLN
jgi:hypothetical protein